MRPHELDKIVARTADTAGLHVTVAEVSRVRSQMFIELSRLPVTECLSTISECLKSADARCQDDAEVLA